ncbi:MAG: hypothetical protein QOE61_4048 [Micromonosporaceae bacterium]|nr:hypothetical protein [Micromonosporaceae bacterium]
MISRLYSGAALTAAAAGATLLAGTKAAWTDTTVAAVVFATNVECAL